MNVPPHIRPFPDGDFVPFDDPKPSSTRNGFSVDPMIVPDRIVVAGGKPIAGERQPPHEIALDLHTLPPVRSSYGQKILETPPAKLTMQDRTFPSVMDDVAQSPAFYRQRRNSIGSSDGKSEAIIERQRSSVGKPPTTPQIDGLPSSSALSLLAPSEETTLLRNHIRKLTSRMMKLEGDVQELNAHVAWIEGLGGALIVVIMLKSLKSLFFG